MRAHYSFLALLAASGSIAAACAEDDANKTKLARPSGSRGGTANGSAGRGSSGTQNGQAGGGGDTTSNGMAGEPSAGSGGTGGSGTSGTGGGAGQSDAGAGGSTSGTGGRGGTGGNAGTAGTSNPGGNGGEAGGTTVNGLYVGTTGSDTASGVRVDPYATLAHAASVAVSGDTIIFLDGSFDFPPGLAIPIPDGVNVVAENPGQVTLNLASGPQPYALIDFTGTSQLDGITFAGFSSAVRASSTTNDTVTITNSRFTSCLNAGKYALEVVNSASLVLSGSPSTDWGDCPAFGSVVDSGTLTITGGILHDLSSTTFSTFTINDDSTLNLSNVTATDGHRQLVLQYGSSSATISDSTVRTLGNNLFTLFEQSSLTLERSDVSIDPAAPFAYSCIQTSMNGVGAISLLDSHVHHCSDAVKGVPPGVLTVSGTEIDTMTSNGISFDTGSGGVIDIFDSNFHDLGLGVGALGAGAAIFGSGGGANIAALTVRNSTFSSIVGLRLAGAPTSTWDLGTLAEPGGNTFLATTSSLQLYTPQQGGATSFVSAVGNTWTAGQQGADGAGQYAPSVGKVNDVVGGYTSGDNNGPSVPPTTQGRNYTIGGGPSYGATLRLAEIP